MSYRCGTRSSLGCGLALVVAYLACVGTTLRAQGAADLPAGLGADILRTRCLSCHDADLVRQQRLTRPGWQREVEKMIRWGAPVSGPEVQLLVEYLATNWGPEASHPPTAAAGRGADVFTRACLICHQSDIVEQQRLGRPGWSREVEKMIRWGANVPDADKDALVDYLAGRFGP